VGFHVPMAILSSGTAKKRDSKLKSQFFNLRPIAGSTLSKLGLYSRIIQKSTFINNEPIRITSSIVEVELEETLRFSKGLINDQVGL